MMTDCSSIQGSTTSSSSDVMTLTTASSWCAIPASARIRVLRLIRPHTRRILVTPDSNPSFGFAIRGGKEFGTGFFVSNVERNSEADSKGLRAGDQILRINGFRVDDAVHKEFIQFVSSQDRITLKVRGVGMVPIKDNEKDPLSWHVVKTTSISNTPSESSYKSTPETSSRDGRANSHANKDINVVLNVAPRTKLGLGICKGPEWKPGIFVQFTKDKSVARESGLRPGDQILSVNSIDFSDVLFSEAVAVMKGSTKLEMRVRTAAGCDLFPGESSGYNSSASSVTGDQSPCWADVKSKRLTAVREEPNATCWNEPMFAAEQRRNSKQPAAVIREPPSPTNDLNATAAVLPTPSAKELNKTIIKLSENGTSINNTYIANTQPRRASSQQQQQLPPQLSKMPTNNANTLSTSATSTKTVLSGSQTAATVMPPPPPPPENFRLLQSQLQLQDEPDGCTKTSQKLADICFVSRQSETKTVIVEVHRNAAADEEKRRRQQAMTMQRGNNGCKLQSNNSSSNSNNNMLKTQTMKAATALAATTGTTATPKVAIGTPKAPALDNCRNKEATNNNNNKTNNNNSNNYDISGSTLSSAISEELKKRKEKQKQQTSNSSNNNSSQINCRHKLNSSNSNSDQQQQLTMETAATLRQRVCRATSNAANCSERNNSSNGSGSVGDQHSALMDEFKRAHQRMFRNGFHESEQRKERQEALKRTTIMEDDVNHRTSSRNFITESTKLSNEQQTSSTVHMVAQQNGQQTTHIPPPPPQFANSPPKATTPIVPSNSSSSSSYKALQKTINASTPTKQQPHTNHAYSRQPQQQHQKTQQELKPPSSPVPDYDNVQIRSTAPAAPRHAYSYAAPPSTNVVTNAPNSTGNRRTMRLGTVTIGEYTDPSQKQQRKEPAKFDFLATAQKQNNNNNNDDTHPESLRSELQNTLSRSNLKKPANGLETNVHTQHQTNCPLQQQQNYENFDVKSGAASVESLTRKLQNAGFGGGSRTTTTTTTETTVSTVGPQLRNGHSNGTGILKKGSRNSGSFTKSANEKTITFGN